MVKYVKKEVVCCSSSSAQFNSLLSHLHCIKEQLLAITRWNKSLASQTAPLLIHLTPKDVSTFHNYILITLCTLNLHPPHPAAEPRSVSVLIVSPTSVNREEHPNLLIITSVCRRSGRPMAQGYGISF